jgi:hypothetical protein
MDGPEDLTGETAAQIGLYAHRDQANQTSRKRRGCRTPAYLSPGASSHIAEGCVGVGEIA